MLPALLIVAVLIPLPARGCELRTVAEHTVAAVIDGQSVRLDNGDEVRLADILAPSASDAASGPAQGAIPVMSDATAWPLAARAQQELAQLVLGRTVQLAVASETGGAQLDRYGRRQAHLQVHRPDGKIWLQAHLLSGGFVRLAYAPGATPCLTALAVHERAAEHRGQGLWREAVYVARDAGRPHALLAYVGTLQVVEGRVRKATTRRGRTYLDFGPNRHRDFTASMRTATLRSLASAGLDVASLSGRRVRVRGWIEPRGGPWIEIEHASQLIVLDE